MDLVESVVNEPGKSAESVFGPLGETILSLAAAIRSGNDMLKNQILDGLRRNGVDSYTAIAMAKFVMDDRKKGEENDGRITES